jgi:glutathione S-transferase
MPEHQADALEIIGAPQSSFVRTVRVACEEKAVAYRLTPAMPHSAAVKAIHPLGKIPVMRCRGVELFESKAIVAFIDRTFPGARLFPEDPELLAKIEQWVSVANTEMFPAIRVYLQSYFFPGTPDEEPDRAAIERVLPQVLAHLDVFDGAITPSGHLVGDTFSYADMNLLPVLANLRDCSESREMLNGSKRLGKYFDRHNARPSLQATIPPPFGELRRNH